MCEYYTKGFARKYDRNRHTLTHYKGLMVCSFCPGAGSVDEKSFRLADVFKRHLIRIHAVEWTPPNKPKRAFRGIEAGENLTGNGTGVAGKCSICSLIFNTAQELFEHLDEFILCVVEEQEVARRTNRLEEQDQKFSNEIKDLTCKLATWESLSKSAENGELMSHVVGLTSYVEHLRIRECFYREERNYFRNVVCGLQDKAYLAKERPHSPIANDGWLHLASPKPSSPPAKLQAMRRETEAMETNGSKSNWQAISLDDMCCDVEEEGL